MWAESFAFNRIRILFRTRNGLSSKVQLQESKTKYLTYLSIHESEIQQPCIIAGGT